MIIERISLKNWKCFDEKEFSFNKDFNLLRMSNGTGKTSMLEAIIFALFDKRPSGYTFNDLKNDNTTNSIVELWVTNNFDEYYFRREFGKNSKYLAEKNGKIIGNDRESYLITSSEIATYNDVENTWTFGTLANSKILNTSYLEELFNNLLESPIKVQKELKKRRYILRANIKKIEEKMSNDSNIGNKSKIKKEIKTIEESLNNNKVTTNSELSIALNTKRKSEELAETIREFESINRKYLMEEEGFKNTYSIFKGMTEEEIERDVQKAKSRNSEIMSMISDTRSKSLVKYGKIVNDLINDSNSCKKCLLCDNALVHDLKTIIPEFNILAKEFEKNKIKDNIKFKNYDLTTKYLKLKSKITKLKEGISNCLNFQEIIDSYNQDNENKINRLRELNEELTRIKIHEKYTEELKEENDSLNECINGIEITEEYIKKIKDEKSSAILYEASRVIQKINTRYRHIIIDEDSYKVLMYDEKFKDTRLASINTLSNGEKTIIALSLIIGISKNMGTRNTIVFDESFGNLDEYNLNNTKEVVKGLNNQVILITHDKNWE